MVPMSAKYLNGASIGKHIRGTDPLGDEFSGIIHGITFHNSFLVSIQVSGNAATQSVWYGSLEMYPDSSPVVEITSKQGEINE